MYSRKCVKRLTYVVGDTYLGTQAFSKLNILNLIHMFLGLTYRYSVKCFPRTFAEKHLCVSAVFCDVSTRHEEGL